MTEKIRVLYVDDEGAFLELGKVYLELSGDLTVTTATSVPEEIRLLELATFDAIVSDYQMPEMNGIGFLKVVRARGDKTPFIIFTGKGREEVVIEALNSGADFYLQKCSEPKAQFTELAHKIRRAVQHRIDENALHAQTTFLISMINSSVEFVIFSLDQKYRYLTFNDKHRKEMQRIWKTDIRIGMNILDCMTDPVLRKVAQENIDRAFRGDAFTGIQHQPDPDIWYEFNWNPIRQSGGDVMGVSVFIRDITEHKRAEQALQEAALRWQSTFDSTQDAICILDVDQRIVMCNRMMQEIVNVKNTEDLVGRHCFEVVHKTTGPIPGCPLVRMLHSRSRQQMELKIDNRWFVVTADPILDKTRTLVGAVHNIRDITERKLAEEALRESENKFATIFLRSPVALTLVSATEGTFVDVNDAFVRMTGYSRDDVMGKTADALGIFTDNKEREQMLSALRVQRCVNGMELKCRIKTGEIRTCLFSSGLLLMGGTPNILSTIEDITERKRADEALRESEERYRSLAETAEDLIFIIDRNDTVVYVNSYCQQMLKKPFRDIIGKPRKGLFSESNSARQYQNLQRVFATGKPLRVEGEILVSGQTRWQDTHLMPLKAADGTIYAVLGISRDITEQKALHDSVQLANRKLNLLSSITRHDIINQLMALKSYLYISRDILHDPVKLEEFITKEQNVARTIEAQISFTKDYQDMGIKAPEWQNVHESIIIAKASLSLRGIAVRMDSPLLEVYADPLLERVFYNLIDNALRYGGEKMTAIRISSKESSRGLVIVCEDDGVGVSADKKEAIFNRGYFKHTGFGLFLSREILSITGITITENGIPGNGARFEITVPKGMWRIKGANE
ncbi:MAG: PAS domain S-box protein [Methanoregula sp.]|nr:PAS domain S-box protein [Methanoregula sp.]